MSEQKRYHPLPKDRGIPALFLKSIRAEDMKVLK